jgi:hypothetical protein
MYIPGYHCLFLVVATSLKQVELMAITDLLQVDPTRASIESCYELVAINSSLADDKLQKFYSLPELYNKIRRFGQ